VPLWVALAPRGPVRDALRLHVPFAHVLEPLLLEVLPFG
jgi:hypothetical protein